MFGESNSEAVGGGFASGAEGTLPRRDVPVDMIRYRDRGHIPVSCKRVRTVVGSSNRYKADPGTCAAVEYLSGNKRAHSTTPIEGSSSPPLAHHYMQPKGTTTISREVAFSRPVSKTPDLYMTSMLVSDDDSHAHLLPQASFGQSTKANNNAYRPLSTTPSPGLHTTRGASSVTNRSIHIQRGTPSTSLLAEEAEYSRAPDALMNVMRDSAAQGGFARQQHRMKRAEEDRPPLGAIQVRSQSTSLIHPKRETPIPHRATPDPLLFSQRSNLLPQRGPSPGVFPDVQREVIQPRLRFERTDYHSTASITQPIPNSGQYMGSSQQYTKADRGLGNVVLGAGDKERRMQGSEMRAARLITKESIVLQNVEEERSRFRSRRPQL